MDAREIEIGPQGTFIDKVIQNPNHQSYKFAHNFTEHYDEPEFEKKIKKEAEIEKGTEELLKFALEVEEKGSFEVGYQFFDEV